MTFHDPGTSWFLAQLKPNCANIADKNLKRQGFRTFLPLEEETRQRNGKFVTAMRPLFPGYIFVKTDLNPTEHLEILKTAGAVRLVGNKDGPISISEATIDSLKIMVATEHPIATGSRFKKGDRVMVVYGPFAGVSGTFIRYRGKGRVIVNIEALGQYAGVDVSEDDVEKLPEIML